MRFLDIQTMGAALVLLLADVDAHSHSHAQMHQARRALLPVQRRHAHSHSSVRRGATSPRASPFESALERRGTTCPFPTDAGLVAVAPDKMNGGWAMAPDVACKSGLYCPYACPPGQVMAQWDPKATSYTYPQSMVGDGANLCTRKANWCRMVVCTAAMMARRRSPFPISHTVSTVSAPSRCRISLTMSSPFARRCCPVMSPWSFPQPFKMNRSWRCPAQIIGARLLRSELDVYLPMNPIDPG